MADRHIPGERLSALLDDELAEDAVRDISRHLRDCPACLSEVVALGETRSALRGLPTVEAPTLLPAVAQATVIADNAATAARRRRRSKRRGTMLLATVVVPVTAAVAFYVAGADNGEVVPETDLFLVEHVGLTGGGAVPHPVGIEP